MCFWNRICIVWLKNKKPFVPLESQPDPSDVVAMHRYYTVLKRQTDFKKGPIGSAVTQNQNFQT